mmetsp:Transcript_3061/g.10962  ORF Transcript_3061/g.10962 Transcript_3061/m.10962 type:complete len:778 (+) Transcript_3061:626-2959(+)
MVDDAVVVAAAVAVARRRPLPRLVGREAVPHEPADDGRRQRHHPRRREARRVIGYAHRAAERQLEAGCARAAQDADAVLGAAVEAVAVVAAVARRASAKGDVGAAAAAIACARRQAPADVAWQRADARPAAAAVAAKGALAARRRRGDLHRAVGTGSGDRRVEQVRAAGARGARHRRRPLRKRASARKRRADQVLVVAEPLLLRHANRRARLAHQHRPAARRGRSVERRRGGAIDGQLARRAAHANDHAVAHHKRAAAAEEQLAAVRGRGVVGQRVAGDRAALDAERARGAAHVNAASAAGGKVAHDERVRHGGVGVEEREPAADADCARGRVVVEAAARDDHRRLVVVKDARLRRRDGLVVAPVGIGRKRRGGIREDDGHRAAQKGAGKAVVVRTRVEAGSVVGKVRAADGKRRLADDAALADHHADGGAADGGIGVKAAAIDSHAAADGDLGAERVDEERAACALQPTRGVVDKHRALERKGGPKRPGGATEEDDDAAAAEAARRVVRHRGAHHAEPAADAHDAVVDAESVDGAAAAGEEDGHRPAARIVGDVASKGAVAPLDAEPRHHEADVRVELGGLDDDGSAARHRRVVREDAVLERNAGRAAVGARDVAARGDRDCAAENGARRRERAPDQRDVARRRVHARHCHPAVDAQGAAADHAELGLAVPQLEAAELHVRHVAPTCKIWPRRPPSKDARRGAAGAVVAAAGSAHDGDGHRHDCADARRVPCDSRGRSGLHDWHDGVAATRCAHRRPCGCVARRDGRLRDARERPP